MKSSLRRSLACWAILFASATTAPPAVATTKETIAVSVGNLLQEGHYTRQKLNEELSKKFLQTYLELLDYSHLFFTQQDVDALNAKYANSIAGDVLLGTLKPAYEIYDLYAKPTLIISALTWAFRWWELVPCFGLKMATQK